MFGCHCNCITTYTQIVADSNMFIIISSFKKVIFLLLYTLSLFCLQLYYFPMILSAQLLKWLDTQSAFYTGPVEGLFLRIDGDIPGQSPSAGDPLQLPCSHNLHRGKLVRPDFLQGIEEQWTRQQLTKNIVTYNFDY